MGWGHLYDDRQDWGQWAKAGSPTSSAAKLHPATPLTSHPMKEMQPEAHASQHLGHQPLALGFSSNRRREHLPWWSSLDKPGAAMIS